MSLINFMNFFKLKQEPEKKPEPTIQDMTMHILNICNAYDEKERRKILTDVLYMASDEPHHIHLNPKKAA